MPALVYFLKFDEKKARGTAIFAILPMVIVSGIFYYAGKAIDWKIGVLCAIGGIFGGIIGAKFLKKLPNYIIKLLFTIFLIYIGIKFLIT